MRDTKSTYDLVQSARSGDAEAFNALVSRYWSRLESIVYLKLGAKLRSKVTVDDVLQEIYLSAFQSLHQFRWDPKASFFQWLSGIAENLILNLARHYGAQKRGGGREVSLDRDLRGSRGDADLPARTASPSKILGREERFRRLENALAGLKPEYRQVIVLARLEGLPMKEIAQKMDRSPEAVGMLLLRALRQLKSLFKETESMGLPARQLRSSLREARPESASTPPESSDTDAAKKAAVLREPLPRRDALPEKRECRLSFPEEASRLAFEV